MVEGAKLLPMVITGLAVLRLKRLVPAVFCIWKAVAELVFLKVVEPSPAMVNLSIPLVAMVKGLTASVVLMLCI